MKKTPSGYNIEEIIAAVQGSTPNKPRFCELFEGENFTVLAGKSSSETGLSVLCEFNGRRYGITGFQSAPSQEELANAVSVAKAYAKRLSAEF